MYIYIYIIYKGWFPLWLEVHPNSSFTMEQIEFEAFRPAGTTTAKKSTKCGYFSMLQKGAPHLLKLFITKICPKGHGKSWQRSPIWMVLGKIPI